MFHSCLFLRLCAGGISQLLWALSVNECVCVYVCVSMCLGFFLKWKCYSDITSHICGGCLNSICKAVIFISDP